MKKIIKKIINLFMPIELFEHLRFDIRSKLGRLLSRSLKLNSENDNFINLGSGNSYVNNFINIDFFGNKMIDYGMDLRYPFKIESNSIDGIFSEHTFEHLSHLEVDNTLSECCRILKPEAKIRIIVPDLSILIERYCSNDDEWFQKWQDLVLKDSSRHYMKKYFTKMFAINFTASYYHHKSCWDFESLKKVLTSNGFVNIEKCNYNLGTPELLIDSDSED
ncbi:MAG: methyltransferase domain-containing protein, partial [SAR202 cluster bacterium]|nr:methyltransferase domain-containing protein [SAR202 cluster bacterium]